MDSKLKKGALGYKSKEVEAYLVELSAKYESDMKAKDNTIDSLNDTIDELNKKIETYEAERLSVADSLIKAQKEAQDIMDKAVSSAEAEKDKIQKECDAITQKIDDAKKTLANMQKDAMKVMEEYKELVAEFTNFSEVSHDD